MLIRRFSQLALVLCVALAAAEALLRLAGLAVMFPQALRNHSAAAADSTVRIMTVGESTTADEFAEIGMDSWPHQLEALLRERGVAARVFNVARPAISTATLLKELPANIEKWEPTIVITMMGINDANNLWMKGLGDESFWSRLRIVRLYQLIAHWGIHPAETGAVRLLEPSGFAFKDTAAVLEKLKHPPYGTLPPEIERNAALLSSDVDRARYFAYLGLKAYSGRTAPSEKDVSAYRLLMRSALLYPGVDDVLQSLTFLLKGLNKTDECLDLLRAVGRVQTRLEESVLLYFAHCAARSTRKAEWEAALLPFGEDFLIHQDEQSDPTWFHYRELAHYLSQHSIAYLAMQYPTLHLEPLMDRFRAQGGRRNVLELQNLWDKGKFENPPPQTAVMPEFSDIIFLSNRENFEAALKERGWNGVFVDRFADRFGHSNQYGNRLIAETALQGVLRVLARDAKSESK